MPSLTHVVRATMAFDHIIQVLSSLIIVVLQVHCWQSGRTTVSLTVSPRNPPDPVILDARQDTITDHPCNIPGEMDY